MCSCLRYRTARVALPGLEDGADGEVELFPRVLREVATGLVPVRLP